MATDVLARGIDVEEVGYVVNYDLPTQPEDYVHRIGRTGRAGAAGFAVSFTCPETADALRDIEKLIKRPIPEMELASFDAEAAAEEAAGRAARSEARRDPEIKQAAKELAARERKKEKAREKARSAADAPARSIKRQSAGKGAEGAAKAKAPSTRSDRKQTGRAQHAQRGGRPPAKKPQTSALRQGNPPAQGTRQTRGGDLRPGARIAPRSRGNAANGASGPLPSGAPIANRGPRHMRPAPPLKARRGKPPDRARGRSMRPLSRSTGWRDVPEEPRPSARLCRYGLCSVGRALSAGQELHA